jgi:hypothetical protein
MPRTWTMTERLAIYAGQGLIERPFSDAELALAQAVAEASYFSSEMVELPSRCPDQSYEMACLDWGILQVVKRRADHSTET